MDKFYWTETMKKGKGANLDFLQSRVFILSLFLMIISNFMEYFVSFVLFYEE